MDLSSGELVDFEGTEISASLIRSLLLDAEDLDPRGLRISNARIEGQLDLRDVVAKRPLSLENCTADAPLLLDRVQLSALGLSGLVAPAVIAPWMRLDHYFYLEQAVLDGGADNYALDLAEASAGGHVSLRGTQFLSKAKYALYAPRLRTGSEVYLTEARAVGTVCFDGARIGGDLRCDGAEFTSDGDAALLGTDMQVDGTLSLDKGFRATAAGRAIRIRGARIGGQLVLRGRAKGPVALDVKHVKTGMEILMPVGFVDGTVSLDGLTYAGLPRDSTLDEWLGMLAEHTPRYATQPYAQLAAAHQAAGHERDVRRIRIAQQRDLLRRGQLTRWGRGWHRITGATVGYGYRPATALLWLLGTLALSIALITVVAGPAGAIRCSTVEQIGYALNAATPLVKTDAQQRCQVVTSTGVGRFVAVMTWVLQLLAWAFATLFVAGFTGLVRKNA